MSKAFTFDLDSVEIVNKSKSEEVEPKVREGKLDELVKKSGKETIQDY